MWEEELALTWRPEESTVKQRSSQITAKTFRDHDLGVILEQKTEHCDWTGGQWSVSSAQRQDAGQSPVAFVGHVKELKFYPHGNGNLADSVSY